MASLGDNIRVVADGRLPNGSAWEASWVWRITAIVEGSSLFQWLSVLQQALNREWYTALNPVRIRFHTGFSVQRLTAVNLNRPTETTVVQANWLGSRSIGFPAPPELTYVVALSTGLRGRSYNGRIYWPCPDSRFVPNGIVDSNDFGVIQRFFNVMRFCGDANDNGTLCVWSRTLSTDDVVFTSIVNTASLRNRVYWQRRRSTN